MKFIYAHEYKGHIYNESTPNKANIKFSPLYKWLLNEGRVSAYEIRKVDAAILDQDTGEVIQYQKPAVGVYISNSMGDAVWTQLKKGDVVYFKDFKGNLAIMSELEFKMNYAEVKEVTSVGS